MLRFGWQPFEYGIVKRYHNYLCNAIGKILEKQPTRPVYVLLKLLSYQVSYSAPRFVRKIAFHNMSSFPHRVHSAMCLLCWRLFQRMWQLRHFVFFLIRGLIFAQSVNSTTKLLANSQNSRYLFKLSQSASCLRREKVGLKVQRQYLSVVIV